MSSYKLFLSAEPIKRPEKSTLNKYKLQIINDDDQLSIIQILSHGDGIKVGKL